MQPYRQGKTAPSDAFKLSSNENPFEPIPAVLEAIAASSVNRYPDASAHQLSQRLAQRAGVAIECVHVGSGSVSLLAQFISAAAGPGDEVVYSWRSFEAYPGLVTVSGATSVTVPNLPDHRHDLPAMAAAITDRTRVVIVCSPNNPTSTIVTADDFAHFMTKRFDREGSARLHMHSLGGMHHADYSVRQLLSYEDYFRTVRLLGMGQPEVDQAYRRMVFNIAARNQDDHVKNLAFLMSADGRWKLAPAFDVTWAYGGAWSMTHQMTARGNDDQFTRDDLLAVGSAFDVPKHGADILAEVNAALERWVPEAQDAGLGKDWVTRIGGLFRHFA